ncbi:MAG: septum formation protein Maf [Bacteroidales bacterium]|nr:septum formation protein Maf [Bacteroidales bacterium]
MDLGNKHIILASNSPRRRELLAGLNIDFKVDTGNNFEEKFDPSTPHVEVPALMARGKSHGFHRALGPDEILITADTMVLLDRVILGKPHSRAEAVGMLELLSGREHEVITGVTIRDLSREETFSDVTYVTFKRFTPEEIDYYVDTCQPFDKAGAYGIQEWIGYIGMTDMRGSFYNVMGFPIQRVYEALQRFL